MKPSYLTLLGALAVVVLLFVGTSTAGPDAKIMGTYWRAVAIDGNPVTPLPKKREAHIMFSAEGKRVSGSTGCNRFTGTFTQTGDSLRFSPLATTKMACPPPLDAQERAFLEALHATAKMKISGNILELKDASDKVRLRLEACQQ